MKKGIRLVGVWALLLWGILFVSALDIIPLSLSSMHNAWFHTLHLNNWEEPTVIVTGGNLNVLNWIIVWMNSASTLQVSTLWWSGHLISGSGNNSWIWWWESNIVNWKESIIWWWIWNVVADGALIAGGENNKALDWGVIVWWANNVSSKNGLILGWSGNSVWEKGIVIGNEASAWKESFSWDAENNITYSAKIDAKNGILIGATQSISGVNLIVNGAVKISWDKDSYSITWEFREINGCFYAYDGEYRHILNQDSSCNLLWTAQYCQFGNVQLKEGDKVYAYKDWFADVCEKQLVTCRWWKLVSDNGSFSDYSKSWCYELK